MLRGFGASFAFLVLTVPAMSTDSIDTAKSTCKDYENGSHKQMMDIVAAFHRALKGDPKFGSLSESALDGAIDKVCLTQPEAKIIDALGTQK